MDPSSSSGKWNLEYAEKFHTHFPMGTLCDLRKIVLGQARKMKRLCMKIIYLLFTHKEQITTNMKRQGNVDHQSKSIVGVPQTAFAKKHRLHT
jgi:hypothetical protein